MIVNSCFPNTHVKLPLTPHQNLAILHRRAFQVREHRVWRRRRLKTNRTTLLVVRSQLGPPLFENLFQNLVSQFPSVNSLDLVAPSLGFASGVAIYLSRLRSNGDNSRVSDVGEWILFTSPTPFNRFVVLRCPSISFEGSNDKLVKEERHFVKLNSGRIRVSGSDDDAVEEGKLVYQRECVSTDDGGVISLDWPADLDLTEEHGLDTTLLLVPGTAEGSMNYDIRSFVCESLKHGCFPVVMNPRGCAGSPLTTPRLFTAGDSDDICTAIQFINSARPWTTLMGVGWGYGANMLTKYLAEVGEKTPLTAVTCIDNPFDLEEATRSSPNHIALDQKLTGGLVDILRSNKELFHGRAKGFDVENGLLAKSVRDFEKSISMISSGFDAIESFYATCSTRSVVGNVKIPVLFIQNDDGTVPLFSIPRSLIAENPFTSLLLCSCSPSSVIASGRSAIPWYRHLTIQWLAAVELGLLKGRHPLLKDVDVTINPSKGLALLEGRSSDKSGKVNKLLNLSQSNGYAVYPMKENLKESDTSAGIGSRFRQDSQRNTVFEDKGLQQESNGTLEQTSPVGAELANEEVSPVDVETGQVLQTAHAVLNMLDVTRPGTLTEEQKKKVLTAVGQGKTVMNALQDAVPEDVRAKLTTAVSGVLQNQGANLKLDGLLNIGRVPDVASGLKSKIGELSSDEDPHSSGVGDLADSGNDNQVTLDKTAGGLESELEASDAMQKPIDTGDTGQVQPTTFGGEISNSVTHQNVDTSKERTAQHVDSIENGSDTSAMPDFPCQSERTSGTEDLTIDKHKMDQDGGLATLDMKEDNIQHNLEKVTNSSADENQVTLSTETEEGLTYSASSSEAQPTESIDNDNVKSEEKSMDSVLNQSSSDSPTFSVSQAFDAFTGMDDSTQVAVNSVFGVIEDMITQLDNKTELDDKNDVKDRGTMSITEKHGVDDEHDDMMRKEENENDPRGTTSITEKHGVDDEHDDTMRKEEHENDPSSQPDTIHNLSSDEGRNSENDARTRWAEKEKLIKSPDPFKGNNSDNSWENGMVNLVKKVGSGTSDKLVSSKLSSKHSNKSRHLQSIPLFIAANPYSAAPLYKEHLLKNLISKIPNSKPLDLDRTTALFLDYIPEEGKWKLLEHPGNIEDSGSDVATHEGVEEVTQVHSPSKADTDEVIEPQYVIMDTEHHQEPVREYDPVDRTNQEVVISNDTLESFVKSVILNSLKVEVGRRLSAESMEKMEPKLSRDMEQVANAVSLAAGQSKNPLWFSDGDDCNLEKLGTLNGDQIIRDMALAIQETNYLRSVLPYGVVVGSCLAALRKYFDVAAVSGIDHSDAVTLHQINHSVLRNHVRLNQTESDRVLLSKRDQKQSLSKSIDGEKTDLKKLSNSTVMVGAVTAVLGASAVMVHQQDSDKRNSTSGTSSNSFEQKGNHEEETDKHEQEIADKSQNNIVTSLAEKAMSVAGPVVPMKEDGKVDQERLVALLAEWGQKGGMLRLVGKIALLWGGIRGAMSLIDRLILFLRIAERPLFQRILGFVCLVLVLWSPVVVPMLPTLMQSWVTHNSSKFAELVCIIGLYCSITMLVMIWGKRIRGYKNPFEQYGLDFSSLSKIQNFLKGLVGGVVVVSAIHSLNVLLGCVRLSWPSTSISHSSDAVTWIKVYGKTLSLVAQGLVTGTCVALVEELIFRSWLPDEIATDLGYYRGIIISGLAFALVQRSPWAIPGLWLLSLGLAGARQRNEGSLSIPIGLRTGVLASNFVLKMGGFLTYQPNFPLWVTGAHPFQPFSGIAGLAISLVLAIVLHPRQPLHQ